MSAPLPARAIRAMVSAVRGTSSQRVRRGAGLALLLLLGLGCASHPRYCPPGYTPVCQSGAIHGTRCTCEPPPRYRDEH